VAKSKKRAVLLASVATIAVALVAYLTWSLQQKEQEINDMQELAALDKLEMENEYERFTLQYSEMMTQINNDSIVEQLTREQLRTQQLLEELKQVKASDAREITRLKKELATVRAVLRSYILQIDSLNQLNEALTEENTQMRSELAEAGRQNRALYNEKASLSEKVAIAAQLDATGITMELRDRKDRAIKKLRKMDDTRKLQVSFTVAKNVTAQAGSLTFYVQVKKPNGQVVGGEGTFPYESTTLKYTAKRTLEYSGEALPVTVFWTGEEPFEAGNYLVSIFEGGNMIGSRSLSPEEMGIK